MELWRWTTLDSRSFWSSGGGLHWIPGVFERDWFLT